MNVIREEMNGIGAQEFLLPSMQPAQIWEKSGRLGVMGEEMFRLKDRKGADLVLGMTHEEIFTTPGGRAGLVPRAAAVLVPVPAQVPGRAAAEERADPGAGVHDEGLLQLRSRRGRAGRLVRGAPRRVRADLRPARHPGDRGRGIQRQHGRQRLDRVHVPVRRGRGPGRPLPGVRLRGQPGEGDLGTGRQSRTGRARLRRSSCRRPASRTIEDLVTKHGIAADRQIKTLVQVIDGQLTLVLLRGDHPLADQKLIDATGAGDIRPAQPDEITRRARRVTGQPGRGRRHATCRSSPTWRCRAALT